MSTVEIITNSEGIITGVIFMKEFSPELWQTMLDLTDDERFYGSQPVSYELSELFQFRDQFNTAVAAGNVAVAELAFLLAEQFKDSIEQFENMSGDGKIAFKHLNSLFKIGSEFVSVISGKLVGSVVHATNVSQDMFGGQYFNVTGLLTKSSGKEYYQEEKVFSISDFRGVKRIEELNVRPMTPTDKKMLTDRGRQYVKHGLGAHYVAYNGNMFVQGMYGPVYFKADGRVMIDHVGYVSNNPNTRQGHRRTTCNADIPESLMYMLYPTMYGFSFAAKRWGELFIEHVSEIKFDDNAFSYLVLNETLKNIVKALVTHSSGTFTDIISGKSGGCIMLLHGPPGTGKTLTCEAVAELLHRPLYSITVGELGTTVDSLEHKLQQILEIATSWNSVILIDEADIFLEKRTDNDIQRNAMVGIFLRLLERHQGVMFLTTNRASSLDEAFRSRISIIIPYKELDNMSRILIWDNLLKASNTILKPDEIVQLSQYKINGRQIKNTIRMAQSLALDREKLVSLTEFKIVLDMDTGLN
jgi:hypothetical protein